jgi:hypothetical protein
MGARYRVGVGLLYRPARLHRLAGIHSLESIPGLHKRLKKRALQVTEENLVSRCSPSRDLASRAVMESCNDQLVAIATSMNQNLTDLLAIMQVGAQSETSVSYPGSGLNQLSGSGSGSRRAKMTHKNKNKNL